MDFRTDLFNNGFLIAPQSESIGRPDAIQEWGTTETERFCIHTPGSLPCQVLRFEDSQIGIIGTVMDPVTDTADTEEIISKIHTEDTFDYIDCLSGRFALIIDDEERQVILQDAAGTMSVFYETGPGARLISSHPAIIAKIQDYKQSAVTNLVTDRGAHSLPGITSPYSQIKRLTPNTLLEIGTGDVERFFPRQDLESREITDELVEEIGTILTNQIGLLCDEHDDVILSLSAGIDSRVSLAASRDYRDEIEYMSWVFPYEDNPEAPIVRDLCSTFGVSHGLIELNQDPPAEFRSVFDEHTSGMSNPQRVNEAYNQYVSLPDDIMEIRSNVAEVARTFYQKQYFNPPMKINAKLLTKLYGHGFDEMTINSMNEFIQTTSFTDEEIYNYDFYDLFYWEHRMGTWMAQWLIEKDLSHDSFIIYNNRELLKKLLSVSYGERRSGALFHQVIEHLWPKCADMEINPHVKQSSRYREKIQHGLSGLAVRLPVPVYEQIVDLNRS